MIRLEILIDEFRGVAVDIYEGRNVPTTKWESDTKQKIIDFCVKFHPDHAEEIKLTKIDFDNPR